MHRSKLPPKGFSWTRFLDRRANPSELREWFTSGRRNIGVVTGTVSGSLGVRDFDSEASYRRWSESHSDLANALPTVRTSRAFHVWGRGNAERTIAFDDGEHATPVLSSSRKREIEAANAQLTADDM